MYVLAGMWKAAKRMVMGQQTHPAFAPNPIHFLALTIFLKFAVFHEGNLHAVMTICNLGIWERICSLL